MDLIDFYSREDVQDELIRCAKDREVAARFGERGFGKRPDILQFRGDIIELVKQGATSFHFSEERWDNPLNLKTGMTKKQLDDLRTGWDLVLDVDCSYFEYSKIMTRLLIDALNFHDIKEISLKFSGNKGFHIGVPFEAFPGKVHNLKTKLLFPDGLRVIAEYLKDMIREPFLAKLMDKEDVETICNNIKKDVNDLVVDGGLDPFKVADIDTVLISNRHMFRAPYSINEKSGLVSVCLKVEELNDFQRKDAEVGKVKNIIKFLDFKEGQDASNLIIQAFDWNSKNKTRLLVNVPQKNVEYDIPKIAVEEKYFPPCIIRALEGGLEDGRKRALFILVNFLRNVGWDLNDIKTRIMEWNKTHPEQLRENYIISQLNWHKKQKQSILPPNCNNAAYYKDLRICFPNNICERFKNPVNYSLRRFNISKDQKKS
jgi:hypothetical protein